MNSNNITNNTIENSSSDVNTTTNQSTDVSDTSTQHEVMVYGTFEDMNLREEILHGIYAYGFERPSAIQQRGIIPLVQGHDVIAQAQSGMGKTATFCIGILQRIDIQSQTTQAIIIAHTRELAFQIESVIRSLAQHTDIKFSLSVRGVPVRDNINELRQNPHIVIGTPGRINDMIGKYALNTETVRILVVDEADEMLSQGFKDQLYNIFTKLPKEVQVGLFSATMREGFFDLTNNFMRNPVKILVKNDELTLEGIRQFYINLERNDYKFDTLCDLYNVLTISQSIVYCNSRRLVEELAYRMRERNFTVACIHGEMSSREREETMAGFRNGANRVLIATDLMARGIDVQQVSVVINYDIPRNIDNYIHRIGRSGRYGRKGVAINFVTYYDQRRLQEIERFYSTTIDEMPQDVSNLIT
mgnify:FL=1